MIRLFLAFALIQQPADIERETLVQLLEVRRVFVERLGAASQPGRCRT
jgi:hypothetical protein